MKSIVAILCLLIVLLTGCTGVPQVRCTTRAAQTFAVPRMALNRAAAPATFVNPPEIPLEVLAVGRAYGCAYAPTLAGPWTTLWEHSNEYLERSVRFTIYATNTAMFYRGFTR